MTRRVISIGSVLLAVAALVVVLYNATLVDRRAPSIARVSLSATANGQPTVAQTITAIDVEFSEPVVQGSAERRFKIEPYVAGTLTWDGSTVIFTPSAKLPADTSFSVSVDPGFEDLAGNRAQSGLDGWAFRTVGPPLVTKTVPVDATQGVPVKTSVVLTFDRLMDTSSVERAIRIEPSVPIDAAWSGDTLTLTFNEQLLFGTTYTLTVGTSAADTAGSRLRDPFTTRFSTVAAGLRVTAVMPADSVAGVSVRSPISVAFDGVIDPASIEHALSITPAVSGSTRVIAQPDDSQAPGLQSAAPNGGNALVFEPSNPLAPHTTYTIVLAPVVSRTGAPGEVAAGRTWTFTTGQPTTSGQNQIAFLSTRAGVRNLWLMNPDGSNPRQLTSELAPVAGFDVTADGGRVCFTAGGVTRLMNIDGSNLRTLTATGRFEYAPHFTPDGKAVLLGRRDESGADLGYWLVPLDGAGGERQVLTSGAPPLGSTRLAGDGSVAGEGSPVWGPRLAFDPSGTVLAVTTGAGEVFVVHLADREQQPTVVDTGIAAGGGPAWSAGIGGFVVVGRTASDTSSGLYTVGRDGSAVRRADAAGSAAAAQSGALAYLRRDAAGATHVAVGMAVLPAAARPLTDPGTLSDRWPAFSPDGRLVLFARLRADGTDTSSGIWTADPGSGALSALSTDGTYPRWLP